MKNLLVVIDVQNGFVNRNTASLPAKIANLIKSDKFDFVAFSKFINKKESNYFKLLGWKKMLRSPDIEIHRALREFTNSRNIFEKTSYSIFKSKKFLDFIKRNNIKKLYLCGIDIDACVLATAFDAFDLGYDVEVLSEYSLSHSGKGFDRAALKIINKNLRK